MASVESDDDDFLTFSSDDGPSASRKFLKRLKKKADKELNLPSSSRKAGLISVLDFSSHTDTSSKSTLQLCHSDDLERHSKPSELQPVELPWKLDLKSGDDNYPLDSDFKMESIKFSEDILLDANEEELAGSDSEKDELQHRSSENGSSSESEEEFDEDDEMAVLNLLQRERKSSTASEKSNPASPLLERPPASLPKEEAPETTHKNKRIKVAELEEMHAASQRLLRETPTASFKSHVSTGKSISSVLEKIRLRKMQLVQGRRSASISHQAAHVFENTSQDLSPSDKISLHARDVVEVEDVGTQGNEVHMNAEGDVFSTTERYVEEGTNHVGNPEELTAGSKSDNVKSTYLGSGNAFRPPMEDTQDLLTPSQSSQEDVEGTINPDNDGGTINPDNDEDNFGGSHVNLHFDTETQDDYDQWQDDEANKENMEPLASAPIIKGPSVRALIDDEAEDEDEDILVAGEDDEGDEGEDLQGMVIEETKEKEKDREKRAELHRKWLEQQDAVMTDDILLRLKTGWRPRESRKRGLDFLDDDIEFVQRDRNIQDANIEAEPEESQELHDGNSQDVEASRDGMVPNETRTFSFPEEDNDVHESDDEEAEQRMMRQRFLQDSEEQGDFESPADDENSRQIFALINKVNIAASHKKIKPGSVNDLRYLGGGTSNSNSSFSSKSSFLRKSFSTTVASVQRQGSNSGSGTRSFIFGRDDSNSSHSFDQHADMREIKENIEPTSGLRKEASHNKQLGQGKTSSKGTKPSATRLGPSLFEILRSQSTNFDKKKSFDENSPVFAAFKPIKATNAAPRGARRA